VGGGDALHAGGYDKQSNRTPRCASSDLQIIIFFVCSLASGEVAVVTGSMSCAVSCSARRRKSNCATGLCFAVPTWPRFLVCGSSRTEQGKKFEGSRRASIFVGNLCNATEARRSCH
jgi:hypothetical protein